MHALEAFPALSRHPKIARYAFSAVPAWLWASDGSRILWSNAVGADLFGAATPDDLAGRLFDPQDPAAREVRRLRNGLPISGAVQLARLRGFSPGLGGILTCAVSRFAVSADPAGAGQIGILIAGIDPARPVMPLAERTRRMFAGAEDLLVFAPDGTLLHAGPELAAKLGRRRSLGAIDADAHANEALSHGHAAGLTAIGPLAFEKLGGGDAVVLIAVAAGRETGGEGETAEREPAAPARRSPFNEDEEAKAADLAARLDDAELRLVERRHPLRFVWRMEADSVFNIESGDFSALAGPRTAALLGRPWTEIAAVLGLDPQGELARAFASRETWSGVTVNWPAAGNILLPVVLSGLPVLARDRSFAGYRGFGVCRDAEAIAAAIAARRREPARASAEISAAGTTRPPLATGETPTRPSLSVITPADNVVPLKPDAGIRRPSLSPVERSAFYEIARALGARLDEGERRRPEVRTAPQEPASGEGPERPAVRKADATSIGVGTDGIDLEHVVLERLPFAVLVCRGEEILFANRTFFQWTGYAGLAAVNAAGGLACLFAGPAPESLDAADKTSRAMGLRSAEGAILPVAARLMRLPAVQGLMMLLTQRGGDEPPEESLETARRQLRELRSVLDTATDGVLLVGPDVRILSASLGAQALFGFEEDELVGKPLVELFAPESRHVVRDYLDGLARGGIPGLLNDGRDVAGRVKEGGLIPLHVTMGRIAEEPPKFCAVFRELAQVRHDAGEMPEARRPVDESDKARADFLARISHEVRTPLNTIIGFAELMMRERLGPLGNDRYRSYMADIHACGTQVIALLDGLLELSKAESGERDLKFSRIDANALVAECVAALQAEAKREHTIIRTSLSSAAPIVIADAESLRQVLLNVLSVSLKLSGRGQVIISTAMSDAGEAVIRVRDTGPGLTEEQIAQALRPFRARLHETAAPAGASGLGLPLAKALAEANRARFQIKSAANAGTLIEIAFPRTRVLSQ